MDRSLRPSKEVEETEEMVLEEVLEGLVVERGEEEETEVVVES